MKNVCYISLFGFILGLFSCNRNIACEDSQAFYLDNEIKAYMLHPVGSYWVYQDSASGNLDTVTVISKRESLETIIKDNENCVDLEVVSYELSLSSYESSLSNVRIDFNENDEDGDLYLYSGFRQEVVFFSKSKRAYIGPSSSSRYLGFSEKKRFRGVDYNDVREYRNSPSTHNKHHKNVFIAKGIGFIRKEYSNGEVWDLIDYKVD